MSRSGRQNGPPPEQSREKFLAALGDGSSVSEAAEATGVSRQHWYRLRAADPEFRAAWAQAWWAGAERLETVLFRAAVDGWDEDDFGPDGSLIRRRHRWVPSAAVAALRARRPLEYRDNPGPAARLDIGAHVHVEVESNFPATIRALQEVGLLRVADDGTIETPMLDRPLLELPSGEDGDA